MDAPPLKKLLITVGVSIAVILVLKAVLLKTATQAGKVLEHRKAEAAGAKTPPPAPPSPPPLAQPALAAPSAVLQPAAMPSAVSATVPAAP